MRVVHMVRAYIAFGACGGPARKRALNSGKLMIVVGLSNWNGSRFAWAAREQDRHVYRV